MEWRSFLCGDVFTTLPSGADGLTLVVPTPRVVRDAGAHVLPFVIEDTRMSMRRERPHITAGAQGHRDIPKASMSTAHFSVFFMTRTPIISSHLFTCFSWAGARVIVVLDTSLESGVETK